VLWGKEKKRKDHVLLVVFYKETAWLHHIVLSLVQTEVSFYHFGLQKKKLQPYC